LTQSKTRSYHVRKQVKTREKSEYSSTFPLFHSECRQTLFYGQEYKLKLEDLQKPEIEPKFEFELHLLRSLEASFIQVQSMPNSRFILTIMRIPKICTPRSAMTIVTSAYEKIGNVT